MLKKIEGVSVDQLLSLIDDTYLEELSQSLGVDKWVKKLKAISLFKLAIFSLFSSERLSLRMMEENFKRASFKHLVSRLEIGTISWTGIRDRLIHVNPEYFKRIYEQVYQQAEELYGESDLEGHHIKRYDSTMIATFSHLLEGMRVGNTSKGKSQVKLTTEFSKGFLIQMSFFQDQAHLSEETALKEVIQKEPKKSKDIVVFDKGLKSRTSFKEIDSQGTNFVTRLHHSPRYDFVKPLNLDDGFQDTEELSFIQDSIVMLYKNGHQKVDKEFRLIEYKQRKSGDHLVFLTNMTELPASEIAKIYRSRWDIEVLFRFMKQEMNLNHFVCNDKNAIQVMLYCTLIASMLILIYKKKNKIRSYKRAKVLFFNELQDSILIDVISVPEAAEELRKKLIQKRNADLE